MRMRCSSVRATGVSLGGCWGKDSLGVVLVTASSELEDHSQPMMEYSNKSFQSIIDYG